MPAAGRGVPIGDGRSSVRFQLLDPLRGLAALWVFTFHFGFSEASRAAFPRLLPIFSAGHLGVPMFFVISGYCLMASVRTALQDGESVASFLRRRSLRIYPAYWCSVAIVAALPFVIEGISTLKTGTFVRPEAAGNINLGFLNYGLAEWLRVLTLTQVFAAVPGAHSLQFKFTTINAVYWTLAIEFQFYLVMAVALALKARATQWLAVVTALSLPAWYLGTWNVVGIFLPYWPMFAVGIGLYLAIERGFSSRWPAWTHPFMPVLSAAGLVVAFVVATVAGYRATDVTFALGLGLALWCLHPVDDRYRKALRGGTGVARTGLGSLRVLGLMSYSLYLLHGRVQFLADQVCRQILSRGIVMDLAVIGLTCGFCYVFYRCCEKPFIRTRTAQNMPPQLVEGAGVFAPGLVDRTP